MLPTSPLVGHNSLEEPDDQVRHVGVVRRAVPLNLTFELTADTQVETAINIPAHDHQHASEPSGTSPTHVVLETSSR
jgi:hypothetical protein